MTVRFVRSLPLALAVAMAGCLPIAAPTQVATSPASTPSAAPSPMPGKSPSPEAPTAITASQDFVDLTVGEEKDLAPLLRDSAGGVPAFGLVWTSANSNIAFVSPNGRVTAVGKGEAIVTATLQATQSQAAIRVTVGEAHGVKNIRVTPATPTLMLGQTVQLAAEVALSDGSFNGNVIWSSADEGVATVDASGVVTPKKPGKVTLYAAYKPAPRYKGSAVVTVAAGTAASAPPLSSVFGPGTGASPAASASPATATVVNGWKKISLGTSNGVHRVATTDGKHVLAVSGHLLYRSTDGGASWSSRTPAAFTNLQVTDLVCASPTVSYAVANAAVYKTTDGGWSWDKAGALGAGMGPNPRLAVTSESIVHVLGERGVQKSTDGGKTWIHQDDPEGMTEFRDYLPTVAGWLARGQQGVKLKTASGWVDKLAGTQVQDLDAADGERVMLATPGLLYRSTDGGVTWTPSGVANAAGATIEFDPAYWIKVKYLSASQVTLTTTRQHFRSADGGQTWTVYPVPGVQMTDAIVLPTGEVWGVADHGVVLHFQVP